MSKRRGSLFGGGLSEIEVEIDKIGTRREVCRADYYGGLVRADLAQVRSAFVTEMQRLGWQVSGSSEMAKGTRELRISASTSSSGSSARSTVLLSQDL